MRSKYIDMGEDPDSDLSEQEHIKKLLKHDPATCEDCRRPSPHAYYISQLIHVEGFDTCRAAIITALSDTQIFVTIFPGTLAPQTGILIREKFVWHDPKFCVGKK